jgi:hypothetical protein
MDYASALCIPCVMKAISYELASDISLYSGARVVTNLSLDYLLSLKSSCRLTLASSDITFRGYKSEGSAHSSMQAHSAFHRHTFSIPNPSRRFTTTSSPRQPIRPARLSKILCSALAVTASKTLVLDSTGRDEGGAGWLVLAFWVGRLISEGKNEWTKRSKGKGKEKEVSFNLGPVSLAR